MSRPTLSPNAQHAYETLCIAVHSGECELTVRDLREHIDRIYGQAVAAELREYLRPEHDLPPRSVPVCQKCGTRLDETDDSYYCPGCLACGREALTP